MEQLEKPTTSVKFAYRVTTDEVNAFLDGAFRADRGQEKIHGRVTEYMKQLPTSIQDPQEHTTQPEAAKPAQEEGLSPSRETTRRGLGRRALSALARMDKGLAYAGAWTISKLPTTMSLDERKEYEEGLAQQYAADENDSRWQAAKKYYGRNKLKILDRILPYGLVTGLGALALNKVMPYAIEFGGNAGRTASGVYDDLTGPRKVTLDADTMSSVIDYTPVEYTYDSKAILIGGRGDTSGIYLYNAMDAQGALAGSSVEMVDNPAGIAPVDPVRMDVSAEIAAAGAFDYYDPNSPTVQTIYGYSEGSAGAIDAYERIVASNNGIKPDNLELVLIGSPYAQGGFFHSDYVGVASPVLDSFGIPTDKRVPEGATVIYSPNDIWANGDNQSFLGMMSQLADLEKGHQVDVNGEFYEKIDSDGVRHLIKKDAAHPLAELAESRNIPLPPGVSEILQQVAPVNNGLSDEVPQPNAYAAFDMTGDLINQQTGTTIGSTIIDSVPQEIKDVTQSSLVAVNNIPNTAAGIANGTISPQEGIPQIMGQVQDVVTDVTRAAQPFLDALSGSGTGVHRGVGANVAPLPPVVAPVIEAPAPVIPQAPAIPNLPPEAGQMINDGMNILNQFLGGLQRPR